MSFKKLFQQPLQSYSADYPLHKFSIWFLRWAQNVLQDISRHGQVRESIKEPADLLPNMQIDKIIEMDMFREDDHLNVAVIRTPSKDTPLTAITSDVTGVDEPEFIFNKKYQTARTGSTCEEALSQV